jgi:hypothetical protein
MLDGPAARHLGNLARERWLLASSERLRPPGPDRDPWPSDVKPDFQDVSIAISRTLPAFMGRPEVREIENTGGYLRDNYSSLFSTRIRIVFPVITLS